MPGERQDFAIGGVSRHAPARIALVVALHVALLWMASRPSHFPAVHDDRGWIQLIQPHYRSLPKPWPEPTHEPSRPPSHELPHRPPHPSPLSSPPLGAPPSAASDAARLPPPAPAAVTDARDAAEAREAPSPANFDPVPVTVVQKALKAAGAVDRELRSGRRQDFSTPPDTPAARLAKGFAAAHAAVGPRWFEAARTELISAPNDPKRIYRITTALGEYCVFYPDKANMSANSTASGGSAAFGQPRMGPCPSAF